MKFEFAIVDCLVEKDGKFLIIKESKPGRDDLYNLPGGHVDGDETLAEAAIRETEEESGYIVGLAGFMGVYQSIYTEKQLNVSGPVFLANVIGGKARTTAEHPEVRWVTIQELLHLYDAGRFWTTYPKQLMQDYMRRGAYPLDAVSSTKL
jgi:ADP-ribose pyrophosphatase YjhB (NUDIX family)